MTVLLEVAVCIQNIPGIKGHLNQKIQWWVFQITVCRSVIYSFRPSPLSTVCSGQDMQIRSSCFQFSLPCTSLKGPFLGHLSCFLHIVWVTVSHRGPGHGCIKTARFTAATYPCCQCVPVATLQQRSKTVQDGGISELSGWLGPWALEMSHKRAWYRARGLIHA